MSDNFLGEIKLLPYGWSPKDWLPCNGQLLSINTYQALFSLIGTTYGGDGRVNFALPDLRGRVPVHPSNALPLGAKAGAESVTLDQTQLPKHSHSVAASTAVANSTAFANNYIAHAVNPSGDVNIYASATSAQQSLAAASVSYSGGGQAHNNCQPSLVMSYCIALTGLFPSRN
jgi:microcystin-dependent protein